MMQASTGDKDRNHRFHILIVDDNDMNRDLMSLQLRRQGYQVSSAASGMLALRMLEQNPYDLILLDIMMPGMNGLDMLVEVRKKFSMLSLPVIMVTADDLEQSLIDALQRGANDYLVKPLNIPVTIARVRSQLTLKELAGLKDEFVRFASHDLKKPLIVAVDIVQSLQHDCVPGQPVTNDTPELLGLLLKTAENMQNVIDGFLNMGSLEASHNELQYKRTLLNRIVSQSVKNNSEYARKKGVVLIEELSPDLPEVEVDEFRITQVMDNLLGNAMKFSPSETVTTVRTRCDERFVYAEISDGGPGLTAADMDKLFQRHAHLSNRPTGGESSSGIGLSLSKQFIDEHRGIIGARNNPSCGATFWFGIPIKHERQ